jgi:hypothetical protein
VANAARAARRVGVFDSVRFETTMGSAGEGTVTDKQARQFLVRISRGGDAVPDSPASSLSRLQPAQ